MLKANIEIAKQQRLRGVYWKGTDEEGGLFRDETIESGWYTYKVVHQSMDIVADITVHEVAASYLLAKWSSGVLLAYLDIPSDSSPSLILVLDGCFVAYKKLPSINTNSAIDVQRDQFSLFFGEVARQLSYFSNCLDENYLVKIYGSGETWHSISNNSLFRSVFSERFPSKELGALDLSQVVNIDGLDSNMLRDMQHDLLGGALANE